MGSEKTGGPAASGWGRTMAKNVLRILLAHKDPVEGMQQIQAKLSELIPLIAPRQDAPESGMGDMLLGGTMTFGSSALFWTGLTAAAGMVLPAVAGAIGLVKLFQGMGKFGSASRRYEFIKTYYLCLRCMERVDNFTSAQEKKFIEALLAPLAIAPAERKELETLAVPKPDELVIPDWLDHSQRLTILRGSWGLLYCDEVTSEEEQAFAALLAKLNLPAAELEMIQSDAEAAMDEQQKIVLRIGAIADFLMGGVSNRWIKEVINALAVKSGTESQVAIAIQKLKDADRMGREEILAKPMGWQAGVAAFFLCTMPGLVEEDPKEQEKIASQFNVLCREMSMNREEETVRKLVADLHRAVPEAVAALTR